MDAGQRLAECRLAASRFADDTQRFAGLHIEGHAVERPNRPTFMPNALRTGKWRDRPSTFRMGSSRIDAAFMP